MEEIDPGTKGDEVNKAHEFFPLPLERQ